MILLRGSHRLACIDRPTVATIGNFDGFHLGHQEVCKFVIQQSREFNASPILISFEPTPKEFFTGNNAPARIYTMRKKLELACEFGFEYFVCLNFKHSLSTLPAVDFVKQILHDSLRIKALVVGDDFRFGHRRSGDINLLHKMGETLGFQVRDQSTIVDNHHRISSTLIRRKLKEGDFQHAATLMGRPFTISGRVFHGDKKGRTIGFPTANILIKQHKSPVHGVFAVTAKTAREAWLGVANIGTRPTVNGSRLQLEAHLFDCQSDLYGERLEVEFHSKLRDEIKFPSFEQLKRQITIDVNNAKKYFTNKDVIRSDTKL